MGNKPSINKLLRIVILLVLLGVALISILLVIKPGASIFHFKQNVNLEDIELHDGFAYRYAINLNPLIFPSEGGLLFEDGQLLKRTYTAEVVDMGTGSYSLADHEDGSYFLHFSASDNSNPLTNEKAYTLYFKVAFLTRTMGLTVLGILTLGLGWFVVFALRPANRKTVLQNFPKSIWQVFDDFLTQEAARIFPPVKNIDTISNFRRRLWIDLLTLSVFAAYFYVFMEWFFFVTKPSFMDLMSWTEKLELLFISSFTIAILNLALIIFLTGLDYLSSYIVATTIPIFLGTLLPSFILSAISLLLVDNFTYTVLKFGIVSSFGIWRYAYGLGFLMLFVYINSRIMKAMRLRGEPKPPLKISRYILIVMASLLIVSFGFALNRYSATWSVNAEETSLISDENHTATRPNILIIGSDGLNASQLSVYGYERETTPVLNELAEASLVAENAFTNSSSSAGSITSMLTGKPPAQTRVLYPPNILTGVDAYQHLPGILRNKGYHAVEIGVPHYVDAYQVNMLGGFDSVNDRSIPESSLVKSIRELGLGMNAYFASILVDRISDRLLHIFFIREMENPYEIVTQPVGIQHDQERLDQIVDLIKDTERPLFLHVHMMGTHGAKFSPEKQNFSLGKTQDEDWMTDFYDDSILTFDHYIGEVLEVLEQTNKIDNTILIVYSDHPMKYDVRLRIPLLIHFPNDEFAGRIKTNVQNLDIAPTILDYLDINQPLWMEGNSLLKGDPADNRLVFSHGAPIAKQSKGKWVIDFSRVKPPFYQFTSSFIFNCQKWYRLNTIDMIWDSGTIPDHTNPCSEDELLPMDQIKTALAEYLTAKGFDISTLP
jgi:glucan phosphoethanolaminetransferase (alkaline phosphatase superfamily)